MSLKVFNFTNGKIYSFKNSHETCSMFVLDGCIYVWYADAPSIDECKAFFENEGGKFINEEFISELPLVDLPDLPVSFFF